MLILGNSGEEGVELRMKKSVNKKILQVFRGFTSFGVLSKSKMEWRYGEVKAVGGVDVVGDQVNLLEKEYVEFHLS